MAELHIANPHLETVRSSDGEPVTFSSVELLSLYTTMVLKRMVTVTLPIEGRLVQLVQVLEHNLKNLKVDKKWFFGTLRDHARLYNGEWRLDNKDGPDRGIMAYNTLLLVVALRLGLEKLWPNDSVIPLFDNMIVEGLTALYHPKKPVLAITQVNHCHPLYDYLSSHSPAVEELYMPRSDVAAFQNSMKFKNLCVMELGGRIPDKVLCNGLWNTNKKSDKVLEMAIKDSKGSEGWLLSLPHLRVFRSNICGDQHTNSIRESFGAAALLIQPKMERVEALRCWNTRQAILHLLETEAKFKNSARADCKLRLKKLVIRYHDYITQEEQLFRACPQVTHLTLLNTCNILKDISFLVGVLPVKQVTTLVLDATNMTPMEFTVLLAEMPNLNDLTLHITPEAVLRYQEFAPAPPMTSVAAVHDPPARCMVSVQPEMLPRNLESLSLNFDKTIVTGGPMPEKPDGTTGYMTDFLSNFPSVKRISFYNTVHLPPAYMVYECIAGALAVLRSLKHITLISCDAESIPRSVRHTDDDDYFSLPRLTPLQVETHYLHMPSILCHLQADVTFRYMLQLESMELDELYLSPRVDRMVAALRASGVLVNFVYRWH